MMNDEDERSQEAFYRAKVIALKNQIQFEKAMVERRAKEIRKMEDLIFLAEGELDMVFGELETILDLRGIKLYEDGRSN